MLICLKIIFPEEGPSISEMPVSKNKRLGWGRDRCTFKKIARVRAITLIWYIHSHGQTRIVGRIYSFRLEHPWDLGLCAHGKDRPQR